MIKIFSKIKERISEVIHKQLFIMALSRADEVDLEDWEIQSAENFCDFNMDYYSVYLKDVNGDYGYFVYFLPEEYEIFNQRYEKLNRN